MIDYEQWILNNQNVRNDNFLIKIKRYITKFLKPETTENKRLNK